MPASSFELFVASRYLRARRKEAVISLITAISVVGVAAGVMSLVVALAVTNGFHNTLERSLLGATAHINIEERKVTTGIQDWRGLADKVARQPHVVAVAPTLYTPVFMLGTANQTGAVIKGVDIDAEMKIFERLPPFEARLCRSPSRSHGAAARPHRRPTHAGERRLRAQLARQRHGAR